MAAAIQTRGWGKGGCAAALGLIAIVLVACNALPQSAAVSRNEVAEADPDAVRQGEVEASLRHNEEQVGNANEAAWRQTLDAPAQAALLARAQAHERLLAGQPDYVPAPRFTQTLALTDLRVLRLARAELLTDLRGHLDSLKHVRREPSSPGAPDDVPETLAAAESRLSRCDLLNVRLLLDFLAQSGVTAEILRLGADDYADKTSEHGGLIEPSDAGLTLRVMAPAWGGSDQAYMTSSQTMERVPTSLALFHMHCHQLDNAADAGPGIGDLTFARTNRVSCVVFTSLDARSLDVDYYNPQGAVVDLGVYHGEGWRQEDRMKR